MWVIVSTFALLGIDSGVGVLMTVAHTKHTGSLDVFENHGEEFRRFGSERSIRYTFAPALYRGVSLFFGSIN